MMTAIEAMQKAESIIPNGIEIIQCLELQDFYAFSIDYIGAESITPGMPTIQVFKGTGKISWMENDMPYWDEKKNAVVDSFENAKEIDINELKEGRKNEYD